MKLQLFTHSRKAMALAWGTILAAGLFSVSARADEWDKKTVLTVNEPIQIRDTYLEPGKYVLKLLNSQSDRHVVQIFNGDESHIINTVLAIPAYRTNPSANTQFTFWETPLGTAKAMRAWYYPGDNYGNEFAYPKQPRQLAMVTPPAPAASASSEETTTTTTTTTTPAQTPVVMDDTASQTTEKSEAVQDQTPPPPDQTATPAPQPPDTSADRAAPAELPKTGSPYPLIGLCGLGLAGLAGALTLKRSA
jgi:LPXTG-motif cell wall-anchored protein